MKKLGFDFLAEELIKVHILFAVEVLKILELLQDIMIRLIFLLMLLCTRQVRYFEQGLPKKWLHQPLGSSGGMSLHESQSLFIEMQIIKSSKLVI